MSTHVIGQAYDHTATENKKRICHDMLTVTGDKEIGLDAEKIVPAMQARGYTVTCWGVNTVTSPQGLIRTMRPARDVKDTSHIDFSLGQDTIFIVVPHTHTDGFPCECFTADSNS